MMKVSTSKRRRWTRHCGQALASCRRAILCKNARENRIPTVEDRSLRGVRMSKIICAHTYIVIVYSNYIVLRSASTTVHEVRREGQELRYVGLPQIPPALEKRGTTPLCNQRMEAWEPHICMVGTRCVNIQRDIPN